MTMNRWNTNPVTCPACGLTYSQYNGVPETCPGCERKKQQAELDRVLKKEMKK